MTQRFRIVLLAVVLAILVIIPIVTAENNTTPSPTGKYKDVPEHHIPPEYFKDAKPPTPISESTMITIVISRQTFERFAGEKQPGILTVPIPYLDFSKNFTNSTSSPTWHYEKSLPPDKPVAMIRMPGTMYDRMLAMSDGKNLELPVSAYVRQYSNLTDLHAQIEPDGMYQAAAPGSDETGTRPSLTVPATILTTSPRTQPAPIPTVLPVIAIGCIIISAAINNLRRE